MKKIYLLLFVLAGLAFKAQPYPGTISYPSTQTICAGSVPIGLQSTAAATVSSGSITYQWESSIISPSSGFSPIGGANGPTYNPGSLAQTTYYRRQASTSPSSFAYSNVITVDVFPLQLATITGSTNICSGYSTTLTAASGGTAYLWSQGSTAQQIVISPTIPGVISVTIVPNTGCSVTATHNYAIDPLPTSTVGITNTLTCAGYPNALKSGPTLGFAYYWFPGNKPGTTYTIAPLTTTAYTVVAQDVSNNCTIAIVYTVNVTPSPTITASASSASVCSGNQATVSASGGLTYTWMPGIVIGQDMTVTPTGASIYTVIGMDANCPDTAFVSVSVYAPISYTFTAGRNTMCKKENNTLLITGPAYVWLNSGMTATTPVVAISPTVTTTYSLVFTDANTCTLQATKTVTVSDCTGLSSLTGNTELSLYPNPSNGNFTIRAAEDCHIRLVNASGMLIGEFELNERNDHSVSVADLAAGLYFVTSASGGQTFRQKILVTK